MRTKIRKPGKMGATVVRGRRNLIDDFYHIFSVNMKDLGSPVHAKKFFINLANEFGDKFHLFVVYFQGRALAAGICLNYKNIMYNPWASSLKTFGKMRPNWLLYWEMIKHAADTPNCVVFDFGRSSRDTGTYDFKRQWGAQETLLWWKGLASGKKKDINTDAVKNKFEVLGECWKHLPLKVTTLCGPIIRKYISL